MQSKETLMAAMEEVWREGSLSGTSWTSVSGALGFREPRLESFLTQDPSRSLILARFTVALVKSRPLGQGGAEQVGSSNYLGSHPKF